LEESLPLPGAEDMASLFLGKKSEAKKLESIPLSKDIQSRWISDISVKCEGKTEPFKPGKYYSFQLDKCTDIIDMAVTLILITF
jgi:hypothetical protein